MHPLGVILAILSGAELAGIAGIFLAVPAVAVLSVMHRHLLEYRGSGGLVSELLNPAQSATDAARAVDPPATPVRAREQKPNRHGSYIERQSGNKPGGPRHAGDHASPRYRPQCMVG